MILNSNMLAQDRLKMIKLENNIILLLMFNTININLRAVMYFLNMLTRYIGPCEINKIIITKFLSRP